MNDFIKTQDEIAKMRIAGKLASEVLMMIKDYVKPGISTGEARHYLPQLYCGCSRCNSSSIEL